MWFEVLTGFREESAETVRRNLHLDDGLLKSAVNGREFVHGRLEILSLSELRQRVAERKPSPPTPARLRVREVVADVQKLHADPENSGALFQVASQFNLLEMVSPSVTPERGVDGYELDRTQGPACAIACGAGTIYRNYFADVDGQIGQTAEHQIDCLSDLGQAFGNVDERLWKMQNGYALATSAGLQEISQRLSSCSESDRDNLRCQLRIGVHWDTQVTLFDASHTVTQAYCSAMPVAYSEHASELWADFAKLVLEASYEATLCAAVLNSAATGNNNVFLTLLGGGAFGNDDDWILSAIKRALNAYSAADLDVAIVSYGASNSVVRNLLDSF